MDKYSELVRTTLYDATKADILPLAGVYVIAYMGKVVYVGKASSGVGPRLVGHITNALDELLGGWMLKLRDDWQNVRLDVLAPPIDADTDRWLKTAEEKLIIRLRPLFNEALNA